MPDPVYMSPATAVHRRVNADGVERAALVAWGRWARRAAQNRTFVGGFEQGYPSVPAWGVSEPIVGTFLSTRCSVLRETPSSRATWVTLRPLLRSV